MMLCLFVVAWSNVWAQGINEEQMSRDITVAENILKSLLKQREGRGVIGEEDVTGSYLDDFGVIFTIKTHGQLFFLSPAVEVVGGNELYIEKRERIGEREAGETDERKNDGAIESLKVFLVDYASIIGQLQPNQRVRIVLKNNEIRDFLFYNSEVRMELGAETRAPDVGSTAELKVSDMIAYKAGKITREQALEKIQVSQIENIEIEEDLDLFAGILETVFAPRYSKNYFISRKPEVDRMKDFGVVYYMKFYSSYPSSFGKDKVHRMPTLRLDEVREGDRNQKVAELYPEFIEDLKGHIIDYGRAIHSLRSDEVVILKIGITSCSGCGIPKNIEVMVKGQTLFDFGNSRIDRVSALKQISIKEIGIQ